MSVTTRRHPSRPALIGASLLLAAGSALADGSRFPQTPHIYVTGEATSKLAPDFVETQFTVARTGAQISDSKKKVDDIANKVYAAAQQLGIKREDYQATDFSVQPQYDYDQGKRIYRGTRVARSFTVKLRNMDKIGDWNNALVKAGVDEIAGFSVNVDGREEKLAALRVDALKKAREEAERLSAALGQKIVSVHTISDTPISDGGGVMVRAMLMKAPAGEAAPELPDTLELQAQAYVVFTMAGKEVLVR